MIALLQFVLVVALAPLVEGGMASLRARLQGRPGPSPLQPYRDLRKLWLKEAVFPAAGSAIVTAVPGVVFGVALTFAALLPALAGPRPLVIDAVALALLLALGRVAIVLAALDTRSSFAAMAASREMTFASLTEAPLIVALVAGGGFLAAAALLLVMLSETARIPVDNGETHYELTMVHEGLALEYSGWQLALVQAAAYVRQASFVVLAALLLPGGAAFAPLWIASILVLIPAVERLYAKMRLFDVPQLFASATVLALASVGLRLAGHGVW
jgi:formate hydrogenlyase subunit 4